jgi:hypothetical protein
MELTVGSGRYYLVRPTLHLTIFENSCRTEGGTAKPPETPEREGRPECWIVRTAWTIGGISTLFLYKRD